MRLPIFHESGIMLLDIVEPDLLVLSFETFFNHHPGPDDGA